MTDRQPDLDETRLSGELATWFAGEVRQAELDLRRAPLRPARARRGPARGIAAPAAGAILVVVLVIAGISRLPSLAGPATEPTGSSIPSSSVTASEPAATATPAPSGVIEGRYADGIPQVMDTEAVLRPSNVDQLGPADDRSFLLGGWSFDLLAIMYLCPIIVGSPPPFGPVCGNQFLAELPLTFGDEPRVLLDGWTPDIPAGPVVLRVHVNDPLATRCAPAMREACEAMAVIEAVVWTGDDVTAAAPLTPIEAMQRLVGADPDLWQAVLTPASPGTPEFVTVEPDLQPLVRCEPPFPVLSWSANGSAITHILVFPTPQARAGVQPKLFASGWEGTNGCRVIFDSLFAQEWVAVDNVMVAVNMNGDGPTPAQAARIDRVREALERQ
jgi:hypothetical protein